MRFFHIIFYSIAISCSLLSEVRGQNSLLKKKVCIELENSHAIGVIRSLEKASGLKFAYESELLDTVSRYSFNTCTESVQGILKKLFSGSNVDYTSISNQIIILKTSKENLPREVRTLPSSSGKKSREIVKELIITEEIILKEPVENFPSEERITNAELLKVIEPIRVNKVYLSDNEESFLVTIDTLFSVRTNQDLYLIYDSTEHDYNSFFKGAVLKSHFIEFWGHFTSKAQIKNLPINQTSYLKLKEISIESREDKVKKNTVKNKLALNSQRRGYGNNPGAIEKRKSSLGKKTVKQLNMISMGVSVGFLTTLTNNKTSIEGELDTDYEYSYDNISSIALEVDYARKNYFLTGGIELNEYSILKDEIGYDAFTNLKDTLSVNIESHWEINLLDNYFRVSSTGDTSWVSIVDSVKTEVYDYEFAYDSIQNVSKSLTTYKYLNYSLGLGYSFQLKPKLKLDTYIKGLYLVRMQDNGVDTKADEVFSKNNSFRYNLSLRLNYLIFPSVKVYTYAGFTGMLGRNQNEQLQSQFINFGIGASYNLKWYSYKKVKF